MDHTLQVRLQKQLKQLKLEGKCLISFRVWGRQSPGKVVYVLCTLEGKGWVTIVSVIVYVIVAHISLQAFQHTFVKKTNGMLLCATYCEMYYLVLSDYLCCGLFLLKRLVLKQNADKTAPFTNLFTAAIQIFNRMLQEKYILFENLARKIYLI